MQFLAPLFLVALSCAAQCTLTLQANLPTGALGAAAITLTLAPMAEAGEGGGPAAPPQRLGIG